MAASSPLPPAYPSPFVSDDDVYCLGPYSLVELSIARLSAAIRSKAEWRTKRHDAHIRSRWCQEAASLDPLLTPDAIQYVLDELDWYDTSRDPHSGIEMSAVDGVWQSDSLLPAELTADIQRTVRQCWGHETSEQRDWHPGSGEQVWDIVHPSLYCLVAGRTRVVAEDVPLERSLGAMCSGRVLSEAKYARLMQQRLAAVPVAGTQSVQTNFQAERDSDDEEATRLQQAELAEQKLLEPTADEVAAAAARAWEEGKINLYIRHLAGRASTIYVKPDASLADVRAEVARRLPKSWAAWSLKRDGNAIPAEDESLPLYAINIHSSHDLTAAVEEEEDKAAVARAQREKTLKAALKPVRLTVMTKQGIPVSIHRLEDSTTVATLLQELCDGTATTKAQKGCYPSFSRGLAPSEQRLYTASRPHSWDPLGMPRKRLQPQHTLAHYQLHNGATKVRLAWERVTAAQSEAETNTVELRLQSLLHAKLPAMLLDAASDATVGWLRAQAVYLLPGYNPYRESAPQCRLYFPSTSSDELSDDSVTLSALGMDKQTGEVDIGVRWEGDDEMKVEGTDGVVKEDEVVQADATGNDESGTEADTTRAAVEAAQSTTAQFDEKSDEDVTQQPRLEHRADDVDDKAETRVAGSEENKGDEADVTLTITTDATPRRILSITVKPSITVRELKKRIRDGLVNRGSHELGRGVPVAEQRLTEQHQQKLMNDARPLLFYVGSASQAARRGSTVLYWSRVETEPPQANGNGQGESSGQSMPTHTTTATASSTSSGMSRVIELSLLMLHGGLSPQAGGSERIPIDYPSTRTIGELRQRALHLLTDGRYREARSVEQVQVRRAAGGVALADTLTLAEAGFADGDTAVVSVYSIIINVTLVLPSGAIALFPLYGDANTTVRQLKASIAARPDGYPVEWQWADLVGEALRRQQRSRLMDGQRPSAASVDDDQRCHTMG